MTDTNYTPYPHNPLIKALDMNRLASAIGAQDGTDHVIMAAAHNWMEHCSEMQLRQAAVTRDET